MKKRHLYAQIKDIQEVLTSYYQKTGHRITFPKAAEQLFREGKLSKNTGLSVPFEEWNEKDPAQLKKIFGTITIDVTDILDHPGIYTSVLPESLSFFNRDIWPLVLMNDEEVHLHTAEPIEIFYVLSGSCTMRINGAMRKLSKGAFCIVAPGTMHDTQAEGDSVIMDVLIKKSTLEKSFSNVLRSDSVLSTFFMNCLYGSTQNYLLFMCPLTPYINSLIRHIFIESYSTRSYSNEVSDSYFGILLAEVLRAYSSTYMFASNKRSTNVLMPLIISYIKNNFRSNSLSETARFFGYEPDYLGKLIRKSTGMYYTDIINTYKTDLAKELLLYTDHSIEEISLMAGFNSQDHFTRTFRKFYGTTPARYRKEHL